MSDDISRRLRRAESALKETRDSLGRVRDEMQNLVDKADEGGLTEGQQDRLERLTGRMKELEAQKDRDRSAWSEVFHEARDSGVLTVENGHTARDLDDDPLGEPKSLNSYDAQRYSKPWAILDDPGSMRSASSREWSARALSAIEKAPGADDQARKAMTNVVEEFDDRDATLAKLAVATSSPAYLRWWGEMLRTGGAQPLLNEREIAAARTVRALQRAMSLTDNAGGYLIPFQLDPAVIITSDGSLNGVRRVARVVQATGDTWNGVSAGATSWSWDGEAAEVGDDSSTFAQPSITIHKAQGFIPISIEAFEDESNVTSEIRRLLAFGRNTLEEQALISGAGDGSNQPVGIVTALSGVAGSVVSATTNNQYGSPDLYKTVEDLPGRYRRSSRSAWFGHIATWNDTDVFETSNGSKLFPGVVPGQQPGTLLGSPTYEAEALTGTNSLGTGNDYVLAYGDFSSYVIADRSSSVEFIPHLFSTGANRPSGQRGIYAYFRTGADSVNDSALRLLKV